MNKRTKVKIRKLFRYLWICSPIYALWSAWMGMEEAANEYPKYGITKEYSYLIKELEK